MQARDEAAERSAEFDAFFQGYITCALWSSNDESDESGGEPLDNNYNDDDIEPTCLYNLIVEAQEFFDAHNADLAAYVDADHSGGRFDPWECAGHDFWLTRNGHGAGFWDRGLGALGEKLTDACKPYGGVDLYVGDAGLIYASGYEG